MAAVEYRVQPHPTVPGHFLVRWRPVGARRWRYLAWTRTVPEASRATERHAVARGVQ